jgi:hypothetical protein
MQERIAQRLTELKAQQQYLVQESLKLAGAIAVLEELVEAAVQERACDVDGVVVE